MKIKKGKGTIRYGPGIDIELSGTEVALAIEAFLVSHGVHISGARTIMVNEELIECGRIYVDPSAYVIAKGKEFSGR